MFNFVNSNLTDKKISSAINLFYEFHGENVYTWDKVIYHVYDNKLHIQNMYSIWDTTDERDGNYDKAYMSGNRSKYMIIDLNSLEVIGVGDIEHEIDKVDYSNFKYDEIKKIGDSFINMSNENIKENRGTSKSKQAYLTKL